jgi:hypothetical protein
MGEKMNHWFSHSKDGVVFVRHFAMGQRGVALGSVPSDDLKWDHRPSMSV